MDATPRPENERHAIGLPGMPNLHSHAFSAPWRGWLEHRRAGAGRLLDLARSDVRVAHRSVTPDDVEAVAAQLYVEMLEAGFTRVGEFHLPASRPGRFRPYADIAEMADRVVAAASGTGIGADAACRCFYAHGDFGGSRRPSAAAAALRLYDLDGCSRSCSRRAATPPQVQTPQTSGSRRTACVLSRLKELAVSARPSDR